MVSMGSGVLAASCTVFMYVSGVGLACATNTPCDQPFWTATSPAAVNATTAQSIHNKVERFILGTLVEAVCETDRVRSAYYSVLGTACFAEAEARFARQV